MLKIKTNPNLDDASCRRLLPGDEHIFFGEDDHEGAAFDGKYSARLRREQSNREVEAKIRYCAQCPVRLACLEAGWNEEFGVWGGWSPQERANGKRLAGRPRSVISEQRETAARLVRGGLSVQDTSVKMDISEKVLRRYLNEYLSLSVSE